MFPRKQNLKQKLKCKCFTGDWGVESQGVGAEARWVEQGRWGGQSVGSGADLCSGDWLLNSTESLRSCMKYGTEPLSRERKGDTFAHWLPATTGPSFFHRLLTPLHFGVVHAWIPSILWGYLPLCQRRRLEWKETGTEVKQGPQIVHCMQLSRIHTKLVSAAGAINNKRLVGPRGYEVKHYTYLTQNWILATI